MAGIYQFQPAEELTLSHTLTQAQAPGSWNAGMLEMVAVTSLQIFTFYTALENMQLGVYIYVPQNLSFYLTSPSHETQQVQPDC